MFTCVWLVLVLCFNTHTLGFSQITNFFLKLHCSLLGKINPLIVSHFPQRRKEKVCREKDNIPYALGVWCRSSEVTEIITHTQAACSSRCNYIVWVVNAATLTNKCKQTARRHLACLVHHCLPHGPILLSLKTKLTYFSFTKWLFLMISSLTDIT